MDDLNDYYHRKKGNKEKQDTNFRKAVSAEERLAVTLRFLVTEECQQSLSYAFRMGKSTVSNIISEPCNLLDIEMHWASS